MYDRESALVNSDITYTSSHRTHQLLQQVKVLAFYLFELAVWLYIAKLFLNFGRIWIIPSVSAMWITGAITHYFVRSQREQIVKETKWTIMGYLAFLFMYRVVIQLIAPISAEQMGAALNITVPAASGMAATGILQSILILASVMTPLGFLIWSAQKFTTYFGGSTKEQALVRLRDTRENHRQR